MKVVASGTPATADAVDLSPEPCPGAGIASWYPALRPRGTSVNQRNVNGQRRTAQQTREIKLCIQVARIVFDEASLHRHAGDLLASPTADVPASAWPLPIGKLDPPGLPGYDSGTVAGVEPGD
jgi:hypothetical protein